MPPAINTIMRCLSSSLFPPTGAALCQLGLALRKEVVVGSALGVATAFAEGAFRT